MKAAFFTDRGTFEIRDVPRPAAGAGEVVVNVHACGICGSDLHFYSRSVRPPRECPGHEIAGRVAAGSPELEAGAPVVVEPIRACGSCPRCRVGEPNLCPSLQILGGRLPGGFADAVVAPATSVYVVPTGVDLDVAMLAEPLAVAVHAARLVDADQTREVLILGAGVIGLLVAFVAVRQGWTVTVSARHPHQCEAARALGAGVVVATDREAILEATRCRAPDVVFETVGGDAATMDLALESVRPGGRIITLGVFTRTVTLHPLRFLAKEVTIVSSMMYCRRAPQPDFITALDHLAHEAGMLAPLITHRVPLDAIARGFAIAADKGTGSVKVAVDVARVESA